MQLTLHATCRTPPGASCLVQAMSARSVTFRRVPSRHGSDAEVYDALAAEVYDALAGYGHA